MSINSVANPSVLDLMNRHGLQQVGQMNAANTNTHIAIRYPATLGVQRARFSKLMYTDLIPIARNQLIRNTRMTGRSVGYPTHDPCPPAQLTRRNHEQQPKPSNPV